LLVVSNITQNICGLRYSILIEKELAVITKITLNVLILFILNKLMQKITKENLKYIVTIPVRL